MIEILRIVCFAFLCGGVVSLGRALRKLQERYNALQNAYTNAVALNSQIMEQRDHARRERDELRKLKEVAWSKTSFGSAR